jgi:hypothetical protein
MFRTQLTIAAEKRLGPKRTARRVGIQVQLLRRKTCPKATTQLTSSPRRNLSYLSGLSVGHIFLDTVL